MKTFLLKLYSVCGLLLILAACTAFVTPTAVPTQTPPPPTPAYQPDMALFETIWQTVNDGFYDPNMNGVDWQAIHDQYQPQIAAAPDGETYYRQLNKMLFELGVSHLAILPASMANELDPITFASGTVGFDLRLINGDLVITAVQPDSPAAKVGLQPGYILTAVNNKTPADFDTEALHSPPYNQRNQRAETTQAVRAQIYGDVGSITITFLDEADQPGEVTLTFVPRPGKQGELTEELPASYVELESRILDNNIGYLRFSGFLPTVLEDALAAIDNLAGTSGLIIDLRGNPGGVFFVRKTLAEKLVGQRTLFWRYQQRDGLETVYLDTQEDAYQSPLVILIDELSASSSEEFAGGLQGIDRATIVGEQSPGRCLIVEILPLDNGDILVYPHGQSQTANGAVLEGNGVTPDVIVSLDRESLLKGEDIQLNTALQVLSEQIKTQP